MHVKGQWRHVAVASGVVVTLYILFCCVSKIVVTFLLDDATQRWSLRHSQLKFLRCRQRWLTLMGLTVDGTLCELPTSSITILFARL